MFNLWYLVFLLGVQQLIVLCTKLKHVEQKKGGKPETLCLVQFLCTGKFDCIFCKPQIFSVDHSRNSNTLSGSFSVRPQFLLDGVYLCGWWPAMVSGIKLKEKSVMPLSHDQQLLLSPQFIPTHLIHSHLP